jgi:hypothetical protein
VGLLESLLKTAIHVATTPVEIVKDVATLGGVLVDEDEPFSVQRAKKLKRDLEEVSDGVDRL